MISSTECNFRVDGHTNLTDQPDQSAQNGSQVPEDHADVVTASTEHGDNNPLAIGHMGWAGVHTLSGVGKCSGSIKPVHGAPEPGSETVGYGDFVSFSTAPKKVTAITTHSPGTERFAQH